MLVRQTVADAISLLYPICDVTARSTRAIAPRITNLRKAHGHHLRSENFQPLRASLPSFQSVQSHQFTTTISTNLPHIPCETIILPTHFRARHYILPPPMYHIIEDIYNCYMTAWGSPSSGASRSYSCGSDHALYDKQELGYPHSLWRCRCYNIMSMVQEFEYIQNLYR